MAKQTSNKAVGQAEQDCSFSATTIAALLFLAAKFPHRQFNSSELCVLSGIGRTAMSQIKNTADSPFFAWKMHVTAARRMACQASRIQATMIGPEGLYAKRGSQKHYGPWFACANREGTVQRIRPLYFHSICSGAGLL